MSDWQTKLLEHWRRESAKSIKQREIEHKEAIARQEAALAAADARFLAAFPHLRPTPERLAAYRDGKCAHCSAGYPAWEHVAHFYCSHACARLAEAAAAAAAHL